MANYRSSILGLNIPGTQAPLTRLLQEMSRAQEAMSVRDYAEMFQEVFGKSLDDAQAEARVFAATSQEKFEQDIHMINEARAAHADNPPDSRKGVLGFPSPKKEHPHG